MTTLKKSTSKKNSAPAAKAAPKNAPKNQAIDLDLLQKVSSFMKDNDILELEVNSGATELKLRRGSVNASASPMMMPMAGLAAAPAAPAAVASAAAPAASAEPKTKGHVITSPFVGTFYRASGPNQDPFVEVGKIVNPGDALCIVEAMKLMNEIESDTKGRIARILVNNGTPVEFGEPLFEIEPL